MKRGFGSVYHPKYRDRQTRKWTDSPTWWISYSFRGVKHRESSNSTNRIDALRLLRKRLEEMGRGRLVGPSAERVTFADLKQLVERDYKYAGAVFYRGGVSVGSLSSAR